MRMRIWMTTLALALCFAAPALLFAQAQEGVDPPH